ncbi:MAG: hypothetical protein HN350_03215 [Phycisphaerales bacterium]|nr:hypothetical protein [Phycisphaerales bacterium]
MKHITTILISVAVLAGGLLAEEPQNHHSDGTRCVPLHRLGLKDIDDRSILPTMPRSMPMSTKNTCGMCHEYGVIADGLHFNSTKGLASGRPGEPWVLVDAETGTHLPLSNRAWKGLYKPEDVGLTPWTFTQRFGRHMPGGDMAAPKDTLSDLNARWNVSGKAEINCLACHNGSFKQDHSEWAKQMARENFMWAGTAASGLGEVGGMGSRQPDVWDYTKGPSPDDTGFATPPAVTYDLSQFDSKNRAMLDVGSPKDKSCLSCHSTVTTGQSKWRSDRDVHSAAGLSCVSCHRNGISHNIVRGYPGEAKLRKDPDVASLSCKGCHIGTDGTGARAMGGRLGAPVPKHAGLPPVHMKKLTCTACHSGPMPKSEPTRVRTARMNRMGIFGRAQWYTEAPNISAGVFVKGDDGKIGPRKMIWPAFWARLDGDKVTPILPKEVAPLTKGVFGGQQQIAEILNILAGPIAEDYGKKASTGRQDLIKKYKIGGLPVFLHGGKLYKLTADGGLDVSEFKGQAPMMIGPFARDWNGEILTLLRDLDPEAEPTDTTEFLNEMPKKRQDILVVLKGMVKSLGDIAPEGEVPAFDFGDVAYIRDLVSTPQEEDKEAGIREDLDKMSWRLVPVNTGAARLAVPRFAWMTKDGDKVSLRPLIPDVVIAGVAATAEVEESFTEQQVGTVLARLQAKNGGKYAYISSGKLFSLADGGKVVASDNPAAEAYSWPMAHGVRPAPQALGAGGCTDCHSTDSAFFFGKVKGTGPLLTDAADVKSMHQMQELDPGFHGMFGMTFVFRPIFKAVLFGVAFLIAALLAGYAMLLIRKLTKVAGETDKFCFPLLDKLAGLVVAGVASILIFTGFLPVITGSVISGWMLIAHVLLGAVFAVALLGIIFFRASACSQADSTRFNLGQKIGFWMLASFGFFLVLTAALATLPVLGMGWQTLMATLHLCMGIGAVVSIIVYVVGSIGKKV